LAFTLLGRIITNVARMPYQQYITENILKPLGMTHTYWEWKNVPPAQLAHGYRWQNEQWQEEAAGTRRCLWRYGRAYYNH
jgi:CubicO group peptidase (beta-lactamase class C family)